MEFTGVQVASSVGTMIAIGTLILTIQKILRNLKKSKSEHSARILQAAKEEDNQLRIQLESKIELIRSHVENLEANINKDMGHLKETYTSEIKNLGEKIENLRDELRQQHSGLIELLSKIVGKR